MTRRRMRLAVALATTTLAAPAVGQMDHSKMHMPVMATPVPTQAAAGEAPGKKPAARKPAASPTSADPHAGHDMPDTRTKAPPVADPHAGHDITNTPAKAPPVADPHAGHDMSKMPANTPPVADPHAGHDMSNTPAGTDLPAGNAAPPPVPTANAADAVYGTPAMEMGRHHLNEFHGGQNLYHVMVNTEAQFGEGPTAFEWDAEGWYGGDIDRLWIKSEGEGAFGRSIEKAEVQALYSRAVGPYFNLQGGLRYDLRPNPVRMYAVAGFEGLAPSFFDVEGALFLSNKGELMARLEGSYDQRITQRLILQPRAEVNLAAQSTRELGVGSGLSDAEIGLRLRYDIRREFAPYVGVQYRRAFGDTRRFLKDEGEKAGGWSLLTGVRVWF